MANSSAGSWKRRTAPPGSVGRRLQRLVGCLLLAVQLGVQAATASAASAVARAATIPAEFQRGPIAIPRLFDRLGSDDIGLVINLADPYSVTVGAYYAKQRGLAADQVLRVTLPVQAQLSVLDFDALQVAIKSHFGDRTQALALAWVQPYAVQCNALTGALALGFDAALCEHSCGRSKLSPLFNRASAAPWRDHHMRISMQIAAPDVESARRLIDRGVAADASLGRRGAGLVRASFLVTNDVARNRRAQLYPPAGLLRGAGVQIEVRQGDDGGADLPRLLLQTGQSQLGELPRQNWVYGALADHLTSFGGQLDGGSGQSNALAWIEGGATASHGTASEPCAHLQKFPHPQVLLGHYLQGATAIEAYWKSVAWPQQSVFIGEPLAAPFAPRR